MRLYPASLVLLLASLVPAQTVVLTVTASQGDGSACTGIKNPGSNVNFTFNCVEPVQGKPSMSHHFYEGGSAVVHVAHAETIEFGDVICAFGVNPANYATGFGSLTPTPTPAFSLSYACAVQIRTAGVVTGNTPGPMGVVTWTSSHSFLRRLFRKNP